MRFSIALLPVLAGIALADPTSAASSIASSLSSVLSSARSEASASASQSATATTTATESKSTDSTTTMSKGAAATMGPGGVMAAALGAAVWML